MNVHISFLGSECKISNTIQIARGFTDFDMYVMCYGYIYLLTSNSLPYYCDIVCVYPMNIYVVNIFIDI